MKIDFSNLPVQWNLEGEPQAVDIRKSLGNHIHQSTGDIALDDTARRIYYSDGPVELTKEHAESILALSKQKYVVPVWQAVEKAVNDHTM